VDLVENKRLAEIFNAIADMMEIEEEKRIFEIKAYRKAALSIESMSEDISHIYKSSGIEGLMEIDGVGTGIAKKIKEYEETGKVSKYEEYKKRFPFDILALISVQGIGPKTAYLLYKNLGVKTLDDLKKAVSKHKIQKMEGLGEKTEKKIAEGLNVLERISGRMSLGFALPYAEHISKLIMDSGLAGKACIAGSTRRMKDTIGDLDILVTSEHPEKIMEFISKMDETEEVIARGDTKITIRLDSGINCDIRVIEKTSFGSGLQYFTGSKAHNIKVRKIAIKKGYKLNEYGLFKGSKLVAGENEDEVYQKLGLEWMEPEMREDRGEVELAAENKLPKIIQEKDILGDLHVHTNYSDGNEKMEDMVIEAIRLGRRYIGFTDHSESEHIANGMDRKKFEKYSEDIDKLNDKYKGRITLLKSSETDILADGSLDWDNDILEEMDYVLASVHTGLGMSKDEMTERIIRSMENGEVDILGHPTDRLINRRPPINMDLEMVFEAAGKYDVALEINSSPERLDLNDENIILAKRFGTKFAINTDSHMKSHLKSIRYGIGIAKRGWLRAEDIINSRPIDKLKNLFR
jgi:DNA polymerase (family 10)